MNREFYVVIEKDEDGFLVGEVPQLRACYAQGRTLDELMVNIREAIELAVEDAEDEGPLPEFVGVQRVAVPWAGCRCCAQRNSSRRLNVPALGWPAGVGATGA